MANASPSSANGPRGNHVCEVYDDLASFHQRAVAFLRDGYAAGQRLEYISSGTQDKLEAAMRRVAGFDELMEQGRLSVRTLDGTYSTTEAVDPAVPLSNYAAATDDALAHGYTGLRVVADATALVRTPAQRDAFAQYEHLIDRYMVDHPFSAMCAYDIRTLGKDAATEIACLHPHVSHGACDFQWYATDGSDVAFSGEVDAASRDAFDIALTRTMPLLPDRRVTVDANGLSFIDHRGMLVLDQHACETSKRIVLRTDSHIVHQLANLLDLRAVRPVRL